MRTYKYLALVLAAAGIFAGCGKENASPAPVVEKPVLKDYNPLVPEKATIATFSSYENIYGNPKIKAVWNKFYDVCKVANSNSTDKLIEACPELKDSEIVKIMNMKQSEICEYIWGVSEESAKWSLFTVVPCVVTDKDKSFIRCPDIAGVSCFKQPLDFAKGYSKIKDIYLQYFKIVLAQEGVDNERIEQGFAEIKKYVSVNEGLYNGAMAVRLTVSPEALEKLGNVKLQRFSPIVTTICGGQLVVFASSEDHLAEIEKMYNGEIPSAAADSKIAKELVLPENNLFRFTMPDVMNTFKAFLSEEDWNSFNSDVLADENAQKYAKALDTIRIDANIDVEKEAVSTALDVVFNDSAVASEIKAQIEPMFNLFKGMGGMQLQNNPDTAALAPLVNSFELKSDDATLGLTFGMPVSTFAEFMKFASEKMDSIGCDCDDDDNGGVFPSEDEIDDDDEAEEASAAE